MMLEAYYYDGIPGGDLEDLYEDPDFPSIPKRYELLDIGMMRKNHEERFPDLGN